MSIYHITADTCPAPLSTILRVGLDAAGAARTGFFAAADNVGGALVRYRTQRRLSRLSDHMLQDFGFEREWDGTIHSLRGAD